MAQAIQKHRFISIDTPLGKDVLLLHHFTGTETLGRLFSFNLELLSEKKHDVDLNQIVGQNVTVRVLMNDGKTERFFNGFVSSFAQTAVGRANSDEIYSSYRATMVPWLWMLTRTANCRIFQEMTAPDIIKMIFGEYGFGGFVEDKLTATYPVWEYCVQYRETAFNFVSRLMEHEGIYYYFKHENGKHMLVLSDSPGAHEPYPGYEEIPFRPTRAKVQPTGYISDWTIAKSVQPGKFTHTDYNFKKPRTPMLEDPFAWPFSQIAREHQNASFEIFDYPGEFELAPEGDQYAKARIEELQAPHEVGSGVSHTPGIATGYKFTMKNNPRGDQNREYLVTSASYMASTAEFTTGATDGDDKLTCSFAAMPAESPFRAARITPKPTIQGSQTAVVVGPPGEEIFTDEFGRVKVQFHWDREHHYEPKSSCWIRVAQTWAGKKWGAVFTPRVGQEVVVSFLEGDPDWPLIVGSVYNQDQMQHYPLPGEKTKSYIMTNSSLGGAGYNELRYEDKAGEEQIYLHGQKDMEIRIEERHRELIKKDCHIIVKGGRKEKVLKNQSLEVCQNQWEKVGQKHALEAGQEIHLKAGMKVIIEAGVQISLKGPGGFIDIGPAGVTIQGTMVLINSGGAAGSGSGSSPEAPEEPVDSATGQKSL
jgi:type VI secretion system secreted protein VgrG